VGVLNFKIFFKKFFFQAEALFFSHSSCAHTQTDRGTKKWHRH
jgi:hypothetical protein